MPQHPCPPSSCDTQVGQRFMVNPTTSWSSARSRAAATALSTPPLIATATRAIGSGPPEKRVALHAVPPGLEAPAQLALIAGGRRLVVGPGLDVLRDVLLRDAPCRVADGIVVPRARTAPSVP